MNDASGYRSKTLRRTHASGVVLLILSAILAVAVVRGLETWGNDPQAPARLLAGVLGGPSLSTGSSNNVPGTLASGEGAGGVPRSRAGLVPTGQNRGQILFGRYCDSCHTAGREMLGPSLRNAQFKSQYKTTDKIAELVRTGGFDMPAYPPSLLADDELREIAEFILSLPEENP